MGEDRRQILNMLAEGKLTADEAERLLVALESPASSASGSVPARTGSPRYLRVVIDSDGVQSGKPTKMNIRVPMQLLRAGVRLGGLMPPQAREKVNEAMAQQGIPFDVGQLRPENLETLIEQLNDLTVDVDQEKTKVRIFCE